MKCKNSCAGLSVVFLGSGILFASFFSPWCVIAVESAIIVGFGVIVLTKR